MAKVADTPRTIDPLARHLESFQNRILSYSRVVTEIMEMQASNARRLLKDLIDTPIEAPESGVVSRLAAARLLQTEVKHRLQNQGASLLPFNMHDFTEAVEYGKSRESEYIKLETTIDEDGNEVAVEKKRGRKGDAFEKVKQYVLDNPDSLKKETPAKDVAVKIEEEIGVPQTTGLQYVYKCRRLHKQHDLK